MTVQTYIKRTYIYIPKFPKISNCPLNIKRGILLPVYLNVFFILCNMFQFSTNDVSTTHRLSKTKFEVSYPSTSFQ